MRYLIKIYAPTASDVIDPFCGTGTTGIACSAEDRNFLGIEVEEKYANQARQNFLK